MTKEKKKVYREAEGATKPEMNAVEALSLAIYNEQSACDFYTDLSQIIKNASGKEKFKFLASDEKRHREILEDYYKKINHQPFSFDPGKAKRITVDVRDNTSASEALDIGIKAEKEAYTFYNNNAKSSSDPEAKKMFLMLAEQEDRHFNLLLAERQALIDQFYWFSLDTPGIMEH
ncbi:MAG TPA: ferritin family protein [candidate division Zixibacteria bacterium]